MKNVVRDLHLLLIYLTGWEETVKEARPGTKIFKAWKGYLFEVLDELEGMKLIDQTGSTRLVILTDDGKREAQKLKDKYSGGK